MADAHQAVWDALQALPKPVGKDDALVAANNALSALGTGQNQQFMEWFDTNWEPLLRKFNG